MSDLQRLKEQLRARALAGDARAGSWARGRARSIQREFIRERWGIDACFALAVFVLAIGVAITMPTDLLKGMVLGAALIAGPTALWGWTVQVTGTAPVMMGDQAEQWTASELRRLDRRWRLINHVALGSDDIDHVVVGPGGAYAVETKWSASSWHSDHGRDRLRQAVAQAQRNARRLRLWQPLKSRQIPVKPVLVLWGLGTRK